MLNFFDIIIAGLGVWRIAHMLKHEAGPWDIFIRIREKFGNSVFGKAMDCVACMSIWFAIIIFVPGIKILMIILSISALAIFLESTYGIMLRKERASGPFTHQRTGGVVPGGGGNVQSPGSDNREDLQIPWARL